MVSSVETLREPESHGSHLFNEPVGQVVASLKRRQARSQSLSGEVPKQGRKPILVPKSVCKLPLRG